MFYSILIVSILCLSSSLLTYHLNYWKISFFLLYVSLTYGYFFVILTENFSPISVTYWYYFLIFIFYHLFFTFSKRFYSRTIIITKKYLNGFKYFKLILWVVLVFIPALLGNPFIFLMVFNPLFAFTLITANFEFFLYLLFTWSWMFILIFCNKFNVFKNFLLKIQDYFSRGACLHFIGNTIGKALCEKVGGVIVCTPIVVSLPAIAGYALEQESQTGKYAINKMHEFQAKHPNSTHDQQYKVYKDHYTSHGNCSMVGRGLTQWGIMSPGAPESIIPNYKSDLNNSLSNLPKR